MRTTVLLLALLPLFTATTFAADPAFSLSKADGEKWVRRMQALARDGWKATLKGNDVILEREKPVRFAQIVPNAAPDVPGEPKVEPPLETGAYRLVLRFGPRMTLDEYERLAALNEASEKERGRLHRTVANIPQKFDQILATTEDEKRRVLEYEATVAKLPRHDLPDLYADEFSIRLILPGNGWNYVYDADPRAECADQLESLARAFGVYSPLAATNRSTLGRHEK